MSPTLIMTSYELLTFSHFILVVHFPIVIVTSVHFHAHGLPKSQAWWVYHVIFILTVLKFYCWVFDCTFVHIFTKDCHVVYKITLKQNVLELWLWKSFELAIVYCEVHLLFPICWALFHLIVMSYWVLYCFDISVEFCYQLFWLF